MQGNVINFFPGANTPNGFYSFFTYLSYKMKYIYIIKGGPGTGKSTFMKNIGEDILEMGFDIEKHHCASDYKSLDGLVIPKFETAILDGTAPHTVEPQYPGVVEEILNLGQFWDSNLLKQKKQSIIKLNTEIKDCFTRAYNYLKIAYLLNNEIKQQYQQGIKTKMINSKAQIIVNNLSDNNKTEPAQQRHLFGSGITPQGLINYYDNITKKCDLRYLITGEPGTGISTVIKKIATTANNYGYSTLHFHCSLDPEKLDLIVIPVLKMAIINNTSPHTVIQNKKTDITINMMECINNVNILQNEINNAKRLYVKYINKSIKQLKKEKEFHDRLEKYYVKAMDFNKVERKRKKVIQKIINY